MSKETKEGYPKYHVGTSYATITVTEYRHLESDSELLDGLIEMLLHGPYTYDPISNVYSYGIHFYAQPLTKEIIANAVKKWKTQG